MARLPNPGGDTGIWGQVLNDFLSQAHTDQGTLKADSVGSTQIQDGAVTNSQLASSAVSATNIADGSIDETKLNSAVQTKLNQTAPVTSVNSQTGDVNLTKADVGLGNVDNTSDADKPISTATQTALDAKANTADVGSKVLLIQDAGSLPIGTPADVVVVLKS